MIEKRNFSRIKVDADAVLSVATHHYRCHIIDISLKGALLELTDEAAALKPQMGCTLQLQLADSDIVIEMAGHLAHIHAPTVGICCENIDLDSITHLKRIVELNLGSTELLERELKELIA
ncbi:PilZ domain-containing protein [Ectothiorhodospiraceae bacterium BW-2]|nr:PilZ domain-containing protein [Ectothiorhodospiraceae bacterium BW-2]